MITIRECMLRNMAAARISDEARLANQIQQQLPGVTRSEALQEAARIVERHGVGVTVQYAPCDAPGDA